MVKNYVKGFKELLFLNYSQELFPSSLGGLGPAAFHDTSIGAFLRLFGKCIYNNNNNNYCLFTSQFVQKTKLFVIFFGLIRVQRCPTG